MSFEIEQINEISINEDCIALVCYVDTGNLPIRKAREYMVSVREALVSSLGDRNLKFLVLQSNCKLEVLHKPVGSEVTIE
jgi:hypothetical protein